MTNKIVRFDDFSGGHWGIRDQSNVGRNMWFGSNVQVYPSGNLGPRSGIRSLSWTGTLTFPPSGQLLPSVVSWNEKGCLLILSDFGGSTITGGRISTVSNGPIPWVQTGTNPFTLLTTPANLGIMNTIQGYGSIYDKNNLATYVFGGNLAKVDNAGVVTTVTIPTTSLGQVVRWRDRLVATDGTGFTGNIYFSDAAAFSSWPAPNVVSVGGDGQAVQWLHPLGDVLYAGTSSAIYAITGVLGSTTTVRHISPVGTSMLGKSGPGQTCTIADGRMALATPRDRATSTSPRTGYAFFNGSSLDIERSQLDVYASFNGVDGPVAPAGDGALFYPAITPAAASPFVAGLVRSPTLGCHAHAFGLPAVDAFASGRLLFTPGGAPSQADRQLYMPPGLFVGYHPGGTGTTVVGYWEPVTEGPTRTDWGAAAPLPASVRFPTTYTQNDKLLRVRTAVINGRYYRNDLTFSSGTPAITMRAGATGFGGVSDAGSSTRFSTPVTFNPQLASSTADDFVARVNFGDASPGEGAFLDITQITNCSIRSVALVLEESGSLSG